jgi:hypothetical protein
MLEQEQRQHAVSIVYLDVCKPKCSAAKKSGIYIVWEALAKKLLYVPVYSSERNNTIALLFRTQ